MSTPCEPSRPSMRLTPHHPIGYTISENALEVKYVSRARGHRSEPVTPTSLLGAFH